MNLGGLERFEIIRARLERDGRVRVDELAKELEVSEMTIRRDLDELAAEGAVERVRGGAIAVGPQRFATRFRQNARAKVKIAQKLIGLVSAGSAIGIDASSTLQRLAIRLGELRDVTVLTNGPETFQALQEHSGVTPLLTGGQLDSRTGSLVGPLATRAARDVALKRFFMSSAGVDADVGSSEVTLEEAEVKLSFAASASQIVLAVDSSKLGHRAPARGFPLERIDVLATELDPDHPALAPYRSRCRVI